MTLNENDTVSLAERGEADEDNNDIPNNAKIFIEPESDGEDNDVSCCDRQEYERLIRTKYKEFFAEDAQRLINKRFKKYKALEEKVRVLEENAKSFSDVEALLVSERERAVRETEERMNKIFKANRARAEEIAVMPHSKAHRPDVTKLTRCERAELASRALKGEKIRL